MTVFILFPFPFPLRCASESHSLLRKDTGIGSGFRVGLSKQRISCALCATNSESSAIQSFAIKRLS